MIKIIVPLLAMFLSLQGFANEVCKNSELFEANGKNWNAIQFRPLKNGQFTIQFRRFESNAQIIGYGSYGSFEYLGTTENDEMTFQSGGENYSMTREKSKKYGSQMNLYLPNNLEPIILHCE